MGRDDIRNLFTMVKREGKEFLKVGRALGGGKRASKNPIDGMWCTCRIPNNDKHELKIWGPSQSHGQLT